MMRRVHILVLILLAAVLIIQAVYSLHWPIAHDEAPLLYESFLMQDEGQIPYRDFFDFQMPGSYVIYYVLGIFSNFNDLRLRILDLLILTALLAITYFFMQRFGKVPALLAGILFGLKYLEGGPSLSLQREYLLLIFIALAIWIAMREELTVRDRLFIGFLFGCAAVIKPHAAIGLIPILLFDINNLRKHLEISFPNAAAKSVFATLIGFLIPIFAITAWLALTGGLTPFIQIARNYWPLYAQINGQMEVNSGVARWSFILNQLWRLGGNGFWLIPAFTGVYFLPHDQKRQAYLLSGLVLCYAIYPALSGQFFPYHYIPFIYFIVLLASLCVRETDQKLWSFVILIVIMLFNIHLSLAFSRQLAGKPLATSTDRADEIEHFLAKNLQAGDTVQPLDWTGGTLLAMLEARAHLATPYVFDFYFYHHVSQKYIQDLRADFIKDLQESKPRFIIEVTAIDKPWVSGEDTTHDFPQLKQFIGDYYSIEVQRSDFSIYIRN